MGRIKSTPFKVDDLAAFETFLGQFTWEYEPALEATAPIVVCKVGDDLTFEAVRGPGMKDNVYDFDTGDDASAHFYQGLRRFLGDQVMDFVFEDEQRANQLPVTTSPAVNITTTIVV